MDNYQGYEGWKQLAKNTFGNWTAVDAASFSTGLRHAGIESCEQTRIYEIGFGNDAFSGNLCSMDCQYFGSELNGILVERTIEFGINVFEGGIKQELEGVKPKSFDAVIALDRSGEFSWRDHASRGVRAFSGCNFLRKPGSKWPISGHHGFRCRGLGRCERYGEDLCEWGKQSLLALSILFSMTGSVV
jgi:hypothetical protein